MSRVAAILIFAAAMAALVFQHPQAKNLISWQLNAPANLLEIRQRVAPELKKALSQSGLAYGAPLHIRIFKEERLLEVWVKDGDSFRRFKTYDICNYSGHLGPKLKEGDYQSPEGFYTVGKGALNPKSQFHLSFNLGFPNAYDQSRDRTGSFLMVHGNCVSIGCYAITDASIEEVYLLVEAALGNGQKSVPVHVFPFRMSTQRLALERHNRWHSFWVNLKQGYDLFEQTNRPPRVTVRDKTYTFTR